MSAHRRETHAETGDGLAAETLCFRYGPARPPAVEGIDITVRRERLVAVLGPNGSGKSSLLRLLSGALTPEAGSVRLNGRPLASFRDRERACRIAVVPQSEASPFPVTVAELVAMGRYPRLGPWTEPGPEDRRAVAEAMHRCSVAAFAGRELATLSGGEAQRARVARALAQSPELLLLDEPTAGLDLHHQMELFHLLQRLCEEGTGILLVTHDLNLAARFSHEILLMEDGRAVAQGAPDAVIQRDLLERVYRWPVRVVEHPGPGPDRRAPQAIPLSARHRT